MSIAIAEDATRKARVEAHATRIANETRLRQMATTEVARTLTEKPARTLPPVRKRDLELPSELTGPALRCPTAEFESRPDARELTPTDIANVALLTPSDAADLLAVIAQAYPHVVRKVMEQEGHTRGHWAPDDSRWTLTPHQVAKLNRKRRQELARS